MASVWKHPRSPFWTGIYSDEAGRTRRFATKERAKTKALIIAKQHEDRSRQLRSRKMTRQAFRAECQRQENSFFGPEAFSTARQFFTTWLAGKTAANAEGTFIRYATTIKRFLEFIGPLAEENIDCLTMADCHAYKTRLHELKLAPATIVVEIKTLRSVFGAARRQNLIAHNPADAVELPKHIQQIIRKTFTTEQVEMILSEVGPASEWYTATLAGWYAGMSLRDATRVPWETVDLVKSTICYRRKKTSRQILIPLHPCLEEHLHRIAGEADGWITPKLAARAVGGPNGLSQEFKTIMRRVGISSDPVATGGKRQLSRLSFHSLRKSCNSEMLNHGANKAACREILGHASDAVNDRYTELRLATLRQAVNSIPRLT